MTALPQPTRDIEQGLRDLAEFGYCIHLDVVDADQRLALFERLDEQAEMERAQGVAWLGNGGRGASTWVGAPRQGQAAPWQGVRTLLNKGRVFVDLAANPLIRTYLGHVFRGSPHQLSSTNGLIVRRGAQAMVVHTDQGYLPFPTPVPVVCNVMTCLTPFLAAGGATQVVPGSHRTPPPKVRLDAARGDFENPVPVEGLVPVECPAGAAIIFEGRLWHTSGACVSDTARYSISTYYALPFIQPQELYAASLHDAVYARLNDDERALFGFDGRVLGRIDPRYPGDRTNVHVIDPYIPELRRPGGSAP